MIELDKGTLFIGTKNADQFQKAGVYMLGIPYDGSTSFRPGSRFGASAAREASLSAPRAKPIPRRVDRARQRPRRSSTFATPPLEPAAPR